MQPDMENIQYTISRLATKMTAETSSHPTYSTICSSMYMDNIFFSTNTTEKAQAVVITSINLLASRGLRVTVDQLVST